MVCVVINDAFVVLTLSEKVSGEGTLGLERLKNKPHTPEVTPHKDTYR